MKIVQKTIRLSKEDYYKIHLNIINTLLPEQSRMVNKEIGVLATFMSLDKSIIEEDMFNTLARKQVKAKLNLSAGGLGNHLKSLIEKKHLSKNEITGIKFEKYK